MLLTAKNLLRLRIRAEWYSAEALRLERFDRTILKNRIRKAVDSAESGRIIQIMERGRNSMSEFYREKGQTIVKKTVKSGISFGSALAMVISFTTWHSVGWAIFHGLLSWVYVIYYVIRY